MLDQDWVEKLELKAKLIIVPELLFGRHLRRDASPFQDMAILIRVRNDLIHYKMQPKEPSYVEVLVSRHIALHSSSASSDYLWVHKLSSSEGIRWANNTAFQMAHALVELIPNEHMNSMFAPLAQNFVEIPESIPIQRLEEAGIDSGSDSS